MSFSFKYLIISIFIVLSKTEIEIGPCIDDQRKILFENGTTYTYGFCSECDPGYFTKYFIKKDFLDLDCEKCPENSNNYGNDVVIDTFSEKILRRYPPTFEVECKDGFYLTNENTQCQQSSSYFIKISMMSFVLILMLF